MASASNPPAEAADRVAPWPLRLLRETLAWLRRPAAPPAMHATVRTGGEPGRVTLVGVGPGDPDLLTIKALKALQAADVLLVDDLVPEAIMALAPEATPRIAVGKRGDRPSCPQSEINALLVALARQGRHVVRVKSGDPMVFGRAGEEIAALSDEGIAVTVVPGITTALALGATLGVSLSQRGVSQQVMLVTGRDRDGGLPRDLDWAAMAKPQATTVVYMGARLAPAIATRLAAEGLPSATPVVVAHGVSRPDETVWTGTLADLAHFRAPTTDQPAILGIGAVFAAARARVDVEATLL